MIPKNQNRVIREKLFYLLKHKCMHGLSYKSKKKLKNKYTKNEKPLARQKNQTRYNETWEKTGN